MSGYEPSSAVSNSTTAPETNTAQAANMSESKLSSGTNITNTGVNYDTWTAAIGDMADLNGLDCNTGNGGGAAHLVQPQPFDDKDDGFFDLLNRLPVHHNISDNLSRKSPPKAVSAGNAAQRQNCNLDSNRDKGYRIHPYTPGQGYVQYNGTHYMPHETPEPEFVEHHQYDSHETHSPIPSQEGAPPVHADWQYQPMVGEQVPNPHAVFNEGIEPGVAPSLYALLGHPIVAKGSFPPRYNEICGHGSQILQSQPIQDGNPVSITAADRRYPQTQPGYRPQHGTIAPAFQPQGSQAQLALPGLHTRHVVPQAQLPEVGVNYVSDDVLAQAAGVAQPFETSRSRKLTFGNLTQAKTAMAARKLKQDWKADPHDDTRPQNDQQRRKYVIQLLDAFEDITQSTDSQAPNTAFSKRWANHNTSPYYHPAEMETVSWKMLDIAERLHAHGPSALSIYDPPTLADISKSRGIVFAARIDAICDLLRHSKARCDKLMKGEGLDAVVGAPKQKMVNVKTNKVQNGQRARLIGEGRKVVKATKAAKVPVQPTLVHNDTNADQQHQLVSDKKTKTPSKVCQPAATAVHPVAVENMLSGISTEYPYAPPNGGQPGAPQDFDELYAHFYPPQADMQNLNQSQVVYGSPGNAITQAYVANQLVSNYGHNHINGYPQPAPYHLGKAQYPQPLQQPAVSQFQRLPSSPRFNARPPISQRRSPVASPPKVLRKRSVDEVETDGSDAPNKRQRTASS
jgi:hypothetical protein